MGWFEFEQGLNTVSVCVGRESELAILRNVLELTLEGDGQFVLVSGEAGIGKTALVQQLVSRARHSDALVLTGAAFDLSTTPPYGPWLEVVRRYRPEGALPPLPDFITDREALARLQSPQALHEAVFAFFADIARQRPLVLVLEDLHWSDQASLDLLRFIARNVHGQRILPITTYRNDEVTRQHPLYRLLPALIRESSAERIELRPIDEAAIRELVRIQHGTNESGERKVVEYLLRRAEGNPLFTLELLRTMELRGDLEQIESNWQPGELVQETVPNLIRQMIERRMVDLSDDTRYALLLAAVIGQEVPLDRWEQVTETAIGPAATEALERHLLEETGTGDIVAFRHALIREAIYGTVALPHRRKLHRQVAEVYLADADPDPEIVAWHLKQASDPRAGEWLISAAEQAERRYAWAIALERHEAAIRILREHGGQNQLLSRVLLRMGRLLRFTNQQQAKEFLEESREVALRSGDEVTAAFALFNIGAYLPTAGVERTRVKMMLDAIETLSNTDQDIQTSGRWAVTRVTAEIDPLRTICATGSMQLFWAGRLTDAIELATRFLPEDWNAETVEISEFTDQYPCLSNADAYSGCGLAFSRLGFPDKAAAARLVSLECYERLNFRPGVATAYNDLLHNIHFPYHTTDLHQRSELLKLIKHESRSTLDSLGEGTATWALDYCFLMEGRWHELRSRIQSEITPTTYHLRYLTMLARARFALYEGELERSKEILSLLLPEGPNAQPEDYAHPNPGEPQRVGALLALEEGDIKLARDWMTAHDAWMDWSGAVLGRSEGLSLRGRIHLAEGDSEAALNYAFRARDRARDPEQPVALIAANRFLGELSTAAEEFDAAEHYLIESSNLAEKCALPFERTLTVLERARLEFARENHETASGLLAEARHTLRDLGARPALQQVRELETRLPSGDGESYFGFTPRELDVLRLLAKGMSDRAIADELFISPFTVMRHVSSILRKMDVDSHTAAAAEAMRRDLV